MSFIVGIWRHRTIIFCWIQLTAIHVCVDPKGLRQNPGFTPGVVKLHELYPDV
jgi:hypothetical protein